MIKIATYSETCKSIEQHIKAVEGTDVLVRMGGTMAYSKFPIHINSQIGTEISIDKFRFNQFSQAPIPTELIFTRDSIHSFVVMNRIYANIWSFALTYFDNRKLSTEFLIKPLAKSGGENIFVVDYSKGGSLMKIDLLNVFEEIGPFLIQPKINVTSEYRVHISRTGDYKITKKVKNNPEDQFVTRENHKVLDIANTVKPRLLNNMIEACQDTAMKMNMELICFDVLYDSSLDEHRFFIVESNTGPELIGSTKQWYIDQINKIVELKTA